MGYNSIKKKKRSVNEGTDGVLGMLTSSFFGTCASVAAAIVLWILATFFAYSCDDPNSFITIFAFFSVYLASAAGGFVAAKINGKSGTMCGGIAGIMFVFILLLVSLFLKGSYSSEYGVISAMLLRGAAVFSSVIGGLLGGYKRTKRRRIRR
jgi:putative membrane protein (TIGR04086 family)